MAEVGKSGRASLATVLPSPANQINGLVAGEALAVGDFVYIKGSDNKVYIASGAAATEVAEACGMVLQEAQIGDGVTIHHGVVVRWGAAMTPGKPLFLSGTVPGQLADAASTGGTVAIARVVDATRIYIREAV